jgi:hypothetical protein
MIHVMLMVRILLVLLVLGRAVLMTVILCPGICRKNQQTECNNRPTGKNCRSEFLLPGIHVHNS